MNKWAKTWIGRQWVAFPPLRWLVLTWLKMRIVEHRDPDEVIMDGEGRPYLLRWHLTPKGNGPAWYLHCMVRPDSVKDPHDHPWDFTTWVLSGGYDETVTRNFSTRRIRSRVRAGQFHHRAASYRHVITRVLPDTWTLVRAGDRVTDWGFYEPAPGPEAWRFVPWREYVSRRPGRDVGQEAA